jgi:2-polyprenyl-3-methyl-5-hydroxy-6-metoxy-1,4-benzoquinol methylase
MQLYIDGIPDETTEKELAPLFAGVRSLSALRVIRDIASGESRGFALATVSDDKEGQEAITRLNGSILAGKKLVVFKVHDTLPGEMEFREWMRDEAPEILRKAGVKDGHVVVDYGCGPGIFSMAAADLVGTAGKVHALDVRPRALEKLKSEAADHGLTNLDTLLIDKSNVSVALATGAADVALLYDVLQEIPDKPALMKEMDRLLKPDGVLSVFPMHLGTDKLMELLKSVDLFQVREHHGYPGFKSASEIVNLTKKKV